MSGKCKIGVLGILISLLMQDFLLAQTETYSVKLASFSSKKYDEFSPVYYKNGIVFCSNMNQDLFVNYSTTESKNLFKILFVEPMRNTTWKSASLLSKDLKSEFNDGPVTFNSAGDVIYFSRNIEDNGGPSSASRGRSRLGLYSSNLVNDRWKDIREFRFNNEWYSVTTPCLSPDGARIYFASDKPGGYGGSDLYYCNIKDDYWDNPVNLGPGINTTGNESYPFINSAGELFFSSDGHPGLGGKDIFFSRFADTAWLPPVALDQPVNSEYDDFGIVTDPTMGEGYFSSKRGTGTIDIYYFKTNFRQQFYSESQRSNQFCYTFNDDKSIDLDTLFLRYEWDFGDGGKAIGANAEHCFSVPGIYSVKQNILDKRTGVIFLTKLSYTLEIREIEQPYVTCPDFALVRDSLTIDGRKSNMPGFKILNYSWDFGDGARDTGIIVNHLYSKQGDYDIKLALTIKNDSSGIVRQPSVFKKIRIFEDSRRMLSYKEDLNKRNGKFPDVSVYDHAFIEKQYSLKTELEKTAVFQLEILSSKTRVGKENILFKNISDRYFVKEVVMPDRTYSYIVGEETKPLFLYPAFSELVSMGIKNVRIRTIVPKDLAEIELLNIKRVYGSSTDVFFMKDDYRITYEGYTMLDQIANMMRKYNAVRLLIETHTDDSVPVKSGQELTQKRADAMINYLVGKNIDRNRFIARGYGKTRPAIYWGTMEAKRLNRRIVFTILYN